MKSAGRASRNRRGAQPARPPRSRASRIWRALGLILTGLLLLILIAAIWVWSHRYDLIERQLLTYLDSQGIDGQLSIASASRTEADIRGVRLSYDGQAFLTLDRLRAEYQWRDLLGGKVERLRFDGLDAFVTVDERGRIIDGWRPPSSGSGTSLPPRGIEVTQGRLRVRSPYGEVQTQGEAVLRSLRDFSFDGIIDAPDLQRGALSGGLSGPITLRRDEEALEIESDDLRLSARQGETQLSDTQAQISGQIDPAAWQFVGDIVLRGGRGQAAGLAGDIEDVRASGAISVEAVGADLSLSLRDARVIDPARRRDLARTLSLAEPLSNVPIARNFAPQLPPLIEDLLQGAEVSTSLKIDHGAQATRAALTAPMRVTRGRTSAIVSAHKDRPLYERSAVTADSKDFDLAFSANLNRPLSLTLTDTVIGIRSETGYRLDGVRSAKGRALTQADWRGRTQDGEPARLGPVSIGFDYIAPDDAPRALTLTGMADYDGDIPGGLVTGLKAGGRLDVALPAAGPVLNYQPNGPIQFDRLSTSSEWSVAEFSGTLDPARPVYRAQPGDRAEIKTGLNTARFRMIRPDTSPAGFAEIDMQVARADMAGTLNGTTQDWVIDFSDLALQSEQVPVEGTDLTLPSGQVTLALSEEARTQFNLSAPKAALITPAYRVRDMGLVLAGTVEDYTLDFQGGQVRLTQGTLPALPARGSMRFAQGRFIGEAVTSFPQAPNQPVNVDYQIVDGIGTADVTIRNMRFTPGGLQPQQLAPALRGKIARVDGAINADLDVRFGGDAPPTGTGTVDILNMSLGTAPGPVDGLSGTVELTSLFPIVTAPDQRLSVDLFDPGVPLRDGTVVYALVDGGVRIERADWPLGDGKVFMEPFTWLYGAPENRVTLRVSQVDVGEFVNDIGDGRLSASGTIEGAIPVVVRGIDVRVEGGRLAVEEGGTIAYRGAAEQLGDRLTNQYAGDAIKALENFNYDRLFAEVDGPLDGDIKLGLQFTGSNPDVLYNVPFQFDVTVEGELFNIARSFNTNATIKSEVGRALKVAE